MQLKLISWLAAAGFILAAVPLMAGSADAAPTKTECPKGERYSQQLDSCVPKGPHKH